MAIVQGLVAWTESTFGAFGALGVFVLAFVESSFFPIPPDVLIIPFSIASPDKWLLYAAASTIGSATGALLGHFIGYHGGRPALLRMAGEEKTARVESYFQQYGDWAIAFAAFTPIPYKVFTVASGTFNHQRRRLLAISVVARGARFFLMAFLAARFGAEAVALLDAYLIPFTLLGMIGGVGVIGWQKGWFNSFYE